jgi:PadR family transcriptional regulator PadR
LWSSGSDIAVRGSKTSEQYGSADDQQLYSGLIRLHVLHHAAERPVYGLWLIEELARHGYKLSSGTLYPMLHNMEEKGYLRSVEERWGKLARRVYRATALGEQALESAKRKVSELFTELFEEVKESKRGRGDRKIRRAR